MHIGLTSACLALAGLLAFTVAPPALAQQAMPVASEQLEELDEVVVRGARLYDLIIEAETRFFELYNELNKDPDYKTNCTFLTLDSDSRIEQRVCMPSFFADAKAEQIRFNILCADQNSYDEEGELLSRGVCYEPPPAELIFMDRRDAYIRNVMSVINSDPRLQDMAGQLDDLHREREMLSRRYDDLRTREQPSGSFDSRSRNRPGAR